MSENKTLEQEETVVTEETAVQTPATADVSQEICDLLSKYGLTVNDAVKAKLDELGVESAGDLAVVKEAELAEMGLKPAKARRLLEELSRLSEPEAPVTAPAAGMTTPVVAPVVTTSLLRPVPAEDAWLLGLKTGGILKVNEDSVIAAIRAAIADVINVKSLMAEICEKIERRYAGDDMVVSDIYWEIKKMAGRRTHRDIFDLINGASSVSDAQRKATVQKVRSILFPALAEGQRVLSNWQELYDKSLMRPGNIMSMMSSIVRPGGPLPSGAQLPDMGILHDAGDQVRNAANRTLSGVGAAAASTIAVDYRQIQEVLTMPNLPAECGFTSREQLFNDLGINVTGSLVRMENALVQYAVSFFASDKIDPANEAAFWTELWQLGSQIDFNAVMSASGAASGDGGDGKDADGGDSLKSVTGRMLTY